MINFKKSISPFYILTNAAGIVLRFNYEEGMELIDAAENVISYPQIINNEILEFWISNKELQNYYFGILCIKDADNNIRPIRIKERRSISQYASSYNKKLIVTANELLSISENFPKYIINDDVYVKNGSLVLSFEDSLSSFDKSQFYLESLKNKEIIYPIISEDKISFSLRLLKSGKYILPCTNILFRKSNKPRTWINLQKTFSLYNDLSGNIIITCTEVLTANIDSIDYDKLTIQTNILNSEAEVSKAAIGIQNENVVEYVSKFQEINEEIINDRLTFHFEFNKFEPKNNYSNFYLITTDTFGREYKIPIKSQHELIENNKFAYLNSKQQVIFSSDIKLPSKFNKRINKICQKSRYYVLFREQWDINRNLILFESFFGSGIGDNPAGLYNLLDLHGKLKDKNIIWAINNVEKFIENFDGELPKNVRILKWDSIEYQMALATAKVIVSNTSIAPYFSRRDGQEVVQTWHGVPLKHLGKDMKNAKGSNRNVIRSLSQTTTFLNPDKFTESKVIGTLDLLDVIKSDCKILPYPRNIVKNTFTPLNYFEEGKKNILFAPTWKGDNKNVLDNTKKIIEIYNLIKEQFDEHDYNVFLKIHLNSERYFKEISDNILLIDNNIPTEYILDNTDILISDYSSIMFDFIETQNKPVISYAYDFEEYSSIFGMYHETFLLYDFWMARTPNELIDMLKNIGGYPYLKKNWVKPQYSKTQEEELIEIFENKQPNLSKSTLKVKVVIVSANELRSKKNMVDKINQKLKGISKKQKLALFHIGEYTKEDNYIFQKLDSNIANYYRVFGYNITSELVRLLYKLEMGENLSVGEKERFLAYAKVELTRSFGNIDLESIEFLNSDFREDLMVKVLTYRI